MTTRNAAAPVLADRGCEGSGALGLRRNRNTSLPSDWRRRIPTPAEYYARCLDNLGSPNEDGRAFATCPLHAGTEHGLEVHLAGSNGAWRCQSCGGHGDLVSFHMRRNALTLELAVHDLLVMGRTMGLARYSNAAEMFGLCREIACSAERMQPHEIARFERSKAERRARDEGVWSVGGAS